MLKISMSVWNHLSRVFNRSDLRGGVFDYAPRARGERGVLYPEQLLKLSQTIRSHFRTPRSNTAARSAAAFWRPSLEYR